MAYTVNQVYEIVNSVVKQAYGDTAVTATDLTGLIAMGNKVLNSATDTELFMSTLINRIGKTIIQNKSYSPKTRNILMDNLEYGTMVQKIYVEPLESSENSSWILTPGTSMDLGAITPPTVKQKIFESRNTWQIEITIPDYQINSAFTDLSTLTAFISSIYTQIENSLAIELERMTSMCINNFMAEKIKYAKANPTTGIHAINLLDEYNKAFDLELTPEEALKQTEFLKFAGQRIKLIINRMGEIGSLFNTEGYKRFTTSEQMHVLFLNDYSSANATYLQSNTFNEQMVALPNYTEVSYWQGQGTTGSFADVSKINVTTSSGNAISQGYIIGFVFDHDALGVMVNRRSSQAFYNPKHELTNKWEKADMGYFNDLSENAVVFYLEKIEA